MTHASLFSGIGGCEVAAAMLGWENLFHCEINPFGRAVLDYWFPKSKSYEDITKTNFQEWQGRVDVLTGGFPCQPFSYAGQRRGAEDDRYLWPEMLRAIQECKPTWVIGENVAGIATMVEQGEILEMGNQTSLFGETDDLRSYQMRQRFTLERVCSDLESIGYEVQPILIPACAVGAPHRRDRIFIIGHLVADTNSGHDGRDTRDDASESGEERLQERNSIRESRGASEVRCKGQIIAPSDSDECGEGTPREGRGTQSIWSNGHAEPSQRSAETKRPDGFHAVLRFAEDSVRVGCEGGDGIGQHSSLIGNAGATSHDGKVGRTSSDTADNRLQHGHLQGSEGSQVGEVQGQGSNSELHIPTSADGCGWTPSHMPSEQVEPAVECQDSGAQQEQFGGGGSEDDFIAGCGRWASFPTVSPIHRGNDGLPFDVDCISIPFNKWRQEALKAYGNAIVPQVMYEIFLAIDQVKE